MVVSRIVKQLDELADAESRGPVRRNSVYDSKFVLIRQLGKLSAVKLAALACCDRQRRPVAGYGMTNGFDGQFMRRPLINLKRQATPCPAAKDGNNENFFLI